MEAARDYAGALIRPLTFMGSQTKRVLFTPLMHPARPFRVSNHDRSSRRGVMASSLQELISKTLDALVIATYPYDVPDYAGYPYDVPDYAGSYPYDVPDYA
nr:CIDEA (del1-70aa)-3XHA [synthetic construct]